MDSFKKIKNDTLEFLIQQGFPKPSLIKVISKGRFNIFPCIENICTTKRKKLEEVSIDVDRLLAELTPFKLRLQELNVDHKDYPPTKQSKKKKLLKKGREDSTYKKSIVRILEKEGLNKKQLNELSKIRKSKALNAYILKNLPEQVLPLAKAGILITRESPRIKSSNKVRYSKNELVRKKYGKGPRKKKNKSSTEETNTPKKFHPYTKIIYTPMGNKR
ncbi:hypothetical protein GUA46_13880 [Muricauda sp. HICW]|uniref:Uncharacterized protein n=1 Tax=Flagellimonas chongwuensis TaxID=2697365 RepID=A0A850NM25_9FLAO|nr:hypothetical protein [Allomuricauda chongwuensis]NVN19435.1 hypothetical protein [Allomuricauda chongwuensis]